MLVCMRQLMYMSRKIDRLTTIVGEIAACCSAILVLLIVVDVLLRYVFKWSSAAFFEMEWHLFAALFLLGIPYTMLRAEHVRVDIFYVRYSATTRAWLQILGTVICLWPFCGVVVYTSCEFVWNAWQIEERSSDPAGLEARYLVKSLIPLSFGLLALQGLSELVKSLAVLTQSSLSTYQDKHGA